MWLAAPELDWRALAGIAFAVIVTLGHIFGESKKKREEKEREEKARERRRTSAPRPPQPESARPRIGTADGGIAPPGTPRREPQRRHTAGLPDAQPRPRADQSGRSTVPRPPRRDAPVAARPTEPAAHRVPIELRSDPARVERPAVRGGDDPDQRQRLRLAPSQAPPVAVRGGGMEGAAAVQTIARERSTRQSGERHRLAAALLRPSNARTAIVLAEIIGPPMALREPRE
ncbi:MAG: hypothetical protein IPM64_07545 [Phycisphaerales bacterium]|nr:hypothetical protein [Phycisphaerales bacterium]